MPRCQVASRRTTPQRGRARRAASSPWSGHARRGTTRRPRRSRRRWHCPPRARHRSGPSRPVAYAPVPDVDRYRLPRTVIPSRYELVIEPDLDAATFAGEERVAVEVVEPVDEILVNADELQIEEAWLEPVDGGARRTATVTLEPDTERARLSLDEQATPGAWVLYCRFSGVLNDKLTGFYRSTFTDDSGEDHVIAVTQFEATHARKAF